MKESEIKVLNFREELIKLCHKYKCNICGSYNDFNDDFCIEFDDGLNYTAKANGISVFTVDANEKREYIIDKYVKSMFRDEVSQMQGLNNIKVSHIIFSNNKVKANEKMENILSQHILLDNVERIIRTKEEIKEIILKDGTRYIWCKPNDNARGYRCNHAFIDRDLSLEIIENNIIPIAFYCSKDTVEMF